MPNTKMPNDNGKYFSEPSTSSASGSGNSNGSCSSRLNPADGEKYCQNGSLSSSREVLTGRDTGAQAAAGPEGFGFITTTPTGRRLQSLCPPRPTESRQRTRIGTIGTTADLRARFVVNNNGSTAEYDQNHNLISGEEILDNNDDDIGIENNENELLESYILRQSRQLRLDPQDISANINYAMEVKDIRDDILEEIRRSSPNRIPIQVATKRVPLSNEKRAFNGDRVYNNKIQDEILDDLLRPGNVPRARKIHNEHPSYTQTPVMGRYGSAGVSTGQFGSPQPNGRRQAQSSPAFTAPHSQSVPTSPFHGSPLFKQASPGKSPEHVVPPVAVHVYGPTAAYTMGSSISAPGIDNHILIGYFHPHPIPPQFVQYQATTTSGIQSPAPQPKSPDTRGWCPFCKKNGETDLVFRSHNLYQPGTRKVICPVLRRFRCTLCGTTGDFAHTRNYCRFMND